MDSRPRRRGGTGRARRAGDRAARPGPAATILGLLLWLASPPVEGSTQGPSDGARLLDPLTASEMGVAVRVLREAGQVDDETNVPLLDLEEPAKARVLGWTAGDPVPRRARAVLKRGRRTFVAVVDLTARRVESVEEVPGVQPGILLSAEWSAAQEIVRRDAGWRRALERRGIEDLDRVVPVPLGAGFAAEPRETSERLVRVVSFDGRGVRNFWGRPIEGLVAVVSLDEGRVVELVDTGAVPVPAGEVDFDPAPPAAQGRELPHRVALAQPDGPGYELEGHRVRWGRWSFHWRIEPRSGPVLSLVRYGEPGARRSILYQASLSEMFVPYTDPSAGWAFRAYLDAGEYGLGRLASRLKPGRDCPAYATLLDATFADDWGNPYAHRAAACLFERSTGEVVWRHFESLSGETASRRATELVLRSIPAVGNYDYVVDWIFRLDGSIRVSVGATGVPQVQAVAGGDQAAAAGGRETAYGRRVAAGTVAVDHDHFFSFRLDLDVDGRRNRFLVERLVTRELEGAGPRRTTWVVDPETAESEHRARLRIDLERPALWRVVNPDRRGPTGSPVSYQLLPGANALPLFGPGDAMRRRAGFIDHHLWVTPYRPDERYAAGDYPNQSAGGDGLPAWTAGDRPIVDTDLVLWYTLGMHHVVRTEDWPVMPTTRRGFELRPFDFFSRNPALELPE